MKKFTGLPSLNAIPAKLRYIALLLIGVMLLGGVFRHQYEAWRTVTYVIPPGVGAGQATLAIPNEINLTVGIKDTLVIVNQDNVAHTFGPYWVGPASTFRHRFRRPEVYQAACTFHQDKQMRVVINPAPWTQVF